MVKNMYHLQNTYIRPIVVFNTKVAQKFKIYSFNI